MHRLIPYVLLAFIISSDAAVVHGQLRIRTRYAVTESEVARAVAKAILIKGDAATLHIQFLTDVLANEANPSLEIGAMISQPNETMTPAGDRKLAVRVRCNVASVCMPFYVLVTGTSEQLAAASLQPTRRLAEPQQRLVSTVILHAGAHVTLVLKGGSARLSLPVLSLQNASLGDKVRVISLDRKHVYNAHALSATLVEGEL